MDNKTICSFVNSKDIKQYLIDTNYEFSTAEAAWLVYQCYKSTLQEKIDAWNEIINTMPDQSVNSFHFDKEVESIHKMIKDYIEMKNETLKMFLDEAPKRFYQYLVVYDNTYDHFDNSAPSSSYDKCYHQLIDEMNEDDEDDIQSGYIRQYEIDRYYYIEAHYNRAGGILDVSIPASYAIFDWNITDFFNCLWFHFPAPFKEGDIIYDPFHPNRCDCPGPVVMTGITPMYYEKDGRDHADTSDMIVTGYFQDKESGTIYHEVTDNYMDYEYYPAEKLIEKRRILKSLSNYIKKEISIELFIKSYHLIILEETKSDLTPRGWFTDEGLRLAGLDNLLK